LTALLAGVLTQLGGPASVQASYPLGSSGERPAVRTGVDARGVARSKLLQARAQLQQGNIDEAEALAKEVEGLKVAWTASDDTPRRVLQDVQKVRQDPKALLQAARAALSRRDVGRAEQYARLADKQSNFFSFPLWGDSPRKVLDDVQKMKASSHSVSTPRLDRRGSGGNTQVAGRSGNTALTKPDAIVLANHENQNASRVPPSGQTTPTGANSESDEARQLIRQARQAMGQRKYDEAHRLVAQARTKKANFGFWEDNPDKVEGDLRRVASAAKPTATATTAAVTGSVPRTKEEARAMLLAGRKQLADGKIDEAAQTAQRVKALTSASWGLFEDSPDRLAIDVNKVRLKRDRAESVRLLAEGRKLYEKGDFEGAARLAYRAEKLHDGYSIWDLGDRPSKLLSDVQTAQARSRKTPLPPASLARNEQKPPVGPELPATMPTETSMPPVPGVGAPSTSSDRLRAQQLVAEAQRFQRDGKLVEARDKLNEARQLNVRFGPEEVSPDFVYQQVAVEARQKVEGLLRQAHDKMAYGQGDVAVRRVEAQKCLDQARTLASMFGQDTRPIDQQLGDVRGPRLAGTPATAVDSNVAQVSHQPSSHGQQLLENARQELRKGETSIARRLAESALTGNHGVKDEAMALLRTIDAEELNQKKLAANRAFDAAMAAYRRREYARASAMFAALDVRLLEGDRQARLREINLTPEMSAGRASASDQTPGSSAIARMSNPGTPLSPVPGSKSAAGAPGTAVASDAADGGLLDAHKQRQKILFEKLRHEGLETQREAAEKFRAGQTDAALELLQDYVARIETEKLEPGQLTLLKRPVESRLSHFRLLKAQKDMAAGVLASRQAASEKIASIHRAEEVKQKNVEKLMKEFTARFKEAKYLEAESLAMRALELDPDNELANAAVFMARRQRDVTSYKEIKHRRERMVLSGLNEAEDEGPAQAITERMVFDQDRSAIARKRGPIEQMKLGRPSEKEKLIERQLASPINISFDNTPLRQVLDELRDVHGINIDRDEQAMQQNGISIDSPISIKLNQISLKSALNLILHKVRMTYVIRDEVLMITTEENAKGKLKTVNYPVADLVIPVENYGDLHTQSNVPTPVNGTSTYTPPTPITGPNTMSGGTAVGAPTGGSMLSTTPSSLSSSPSTNGTSVSKRGASNTTEEHLIKLITSTIEPKSWGDAGGPGNIEYFPLTMSLIINQTPDIQEQIQDLLASLRRLQDQEVSVEVRFISVSEDFFERIGVNFNMNILTRNQRFEPALQTNAFTFDNSQFINAFRPGRFIGGITPAGTFTPTLDIPITQNSFLQTVPSFGGYLPGGLSMGLAFLSDIQVFLFLEAAQGDLRSNVMQAPKLTLFNGQTATISITNTQNLVTGVNVVQLPGGQFTFVPSVTQNPFNSTTLTVQAVISADRRFVRMSLTPTITNVAPNAAPNIFGGVGGIPVFPIVVPIFTSIEGNQAGQPVLLTQFIQTPATSNINIQTTVAVPDGGTVLLGGLKSLSEARSEYGPPLLSKVPYINRLFKNVGYGRETESLMIMVTPRIIIQTEEEERQTGFREAPASGGGT
jgi:type II secretory pathway component GspD/PulD (secretin)/tetratricopeptide (TPR) repeat protein